MPRDIFNDERSREAIGVIPRIPETYSVLCKSLGISQGEIPIWADVDDAIIRRRARSLRIDDTGPAEEILARVEARYLEQAARVYSVPPSWDQISRSYVARNNPLSPEERLREQKRFQTAMALQLNKYLATWKEINKELEELGLIPFVNI